MGMAVNNIRIVTRISMQNNVLPLASEITSPNRRDILPLLRSECWNLRAEL
jgi:hypothetical protein